MAAINPSQEATFKSTNDLKITILQSDILDLKADVFVTGEFPNLSPPSELCQSFCRGTRIRTEEWIKDIKLLYSRLEHKTVISKITKYPNPIVFHVIFDPFQLATRDLEGLYLDVLNKAEKLQCRSLAMPLLDKKTSAIDGLMTCLANHQKRYLDHVYLGTSSSADFRKACDSGRKHLKTEREPISHTTFKMPSVNTGQTYSVHATASFDENTETSLDHGSEALSRDITPAEKSEHFTNEFGIKIIVSHSDIIDSDTDVLVTVEREILLIPSDILKRYCLKERLSHTAWEKYLQKKYGCSYFDPKRVYRSEKPKVLSFRCVFHVIAKYYPDYRKDECLQSMKQLYRYVVEKATGYGMFSIALPLLATDTTPRDWAIKAAEQALSETMSSTVTEIHLVASTSKDYEKICHNFRDCSSFHQYKNDTKNGILFDPSVNTNGTDMEWSNSKHGLTSLQNKSTSLDLYTSRTMTSTVTSLQNRSTSPDPYTSRTMTSTVTSLQNKSTSLDTYTSRTMTSTVTSLQNRSTSPDPYTSRTMTSTVTSLQNRSTSPDPYTSRTMTSTVTSLQNKSMSPDPYTSRTTSSTVTSLQNKSTSPDPYTSSTTSSTVTSLQNKSMSLDPYTSRTTSSTVTSLQNKSYGLPRSNLPSGRIDSPHPTNHFKLENGLNFVVHLEDILQVRGDAVVTGESPNLSVKSLVTQKLCESGGISFSVWRNMLLRSHRRMEHGKVYDTLLTITDLPFRYSFHAIMYTYQSGNDMEWAFGMDEIYLNIVKKAEEKVLKSIVVPLLGSGRAGVPVELAIQVLLNSLSSKPIRFLKEVHLALVDEKIYKMVIKECQNLNCKPELDSDPEPDRKPKPESKTHPKPDPEPDSKLKLESETQPKPDPEPGRKPKPESETHSKPDPEPNSLPKPESETHSKPDPEPKPNREPKEAWDTTCNSLSTAKSESHIHGEMVGADVTGSDQASFGHKTDLPPERGLEYTSESEPSFEYKTDLPPERGLGYTSAFEASFGYKTDLPPERGLGYTSASEPSVGYKTDLPPRGLGLSSESENRSFAKDKHACRIDDDGKIDVDDIAMQKMTDNITESSATGRDQDFLDAKFKATKPRDEFQMSGPYRDTKGRHDLEPSSAATATATAADDDQQTVDKGIKDSTTEGPTEVHDSCPICMDDISNPKKLHKCGHVFCKACIDTCFKTFKPVCPTCNTIYGEIKGTQPLGSMKVTHDTNSCLPGYEKYGTITITYHFRNGIQGPEHPNPGSRYRGTTRTAYLPDSPEGNTILQLLQISFKRKVTFTIGRSTTTGREDVITWNDIHHKTRVNGGPDRFGYPDATYLSRVKSELESKGITEADLSQTS